MAADTQLDIKYALLMSSRLPLFKVKSTRPYKINFRCVICGDSQKKASLTRGWLTEGRTGGLRFKCFNCNAQVGKSNSFYDFLQMQDPILFKDYVTERYMNDAKTVKTDDVPEEIKKAPVFDNSPLKKIKKLSQLAPDHPVKQYVQSRQIPSDKHYLLYYAPKFKTWINTILPGKFDMTFPNGKPKRDEPRLILPFFDENGNLFGVSARGFDPDGLRYITIMFDESKPKIFGLSTVDWDKPYFVVEGAIDSLFLPNAIAMAGADGNMGGLSHTENATIVYDNEPRNAEIHKAMERLIRAGQRVCVWPSWVKEKDINAMVLDGMSDIPKIIADNSYKGLTASLYLNAWRKT